MPNSDDTDRAAFGELFEPNPTKRVHEFPEDQDPEDCEHGCWNPDNRQCLDCGHISPEDLPAGRVNNVVTQHS